jgi:hypothetical protein
VEGSEVLQTLAEVAIALTGFTGIVVALHGRAGEPLSGFSLVRFRVLLIASLFAVAFSLLPFFFHHLGLSPPVTWSVCSGLVCCLMVAIAIHDIRAVRTYKDVMPRLDRQVMPLILVLGSALWFLQVANIFELHAFGPYLAAPMWFLGFSAFQFGRLLLAAEER